jgi:hypothetical protein
VIIQLSIVSISAGYGIKIDVIEEEARACLAKFVKRLGALAEKGLGSTTSS